MKLRDHGPILLTILLGGVVIGGGILLRQKMVDKPGDSMAHLEQVSGNSSITPGNISHTGSPSVKATAMVLSTPETTLDSRSTSVEAVIGELSDPSPDSKNRVAPMVPPKKSLPFVKINGPANAETVILSFLRRTNLPAAYGITDIGTLKILPPLRQFRLSQAALMNGVGLAAATPDGFVYSILQNEQPVIAAVVHRTASGAANPNGIILSSRTGAVNNALNQLQSLGPIPGGPYEICILLLQLSGSGVTPVFWLKSANGTADLIYPVNPGQGMLTNFTNRAYNPNEFFSALHAAQ